MRSLIDLTVWEHVSSARQNQIRQDRTVLYSTVTSRGLQIGREILLDMPMTRHRGPRTASRLLSGHKQSVSYQGRQRNAEWGRLHRERRNMIQSAYPQDILHLQRLQRKMNRERDSAAVRKRASLEAIRVRRERILKAWQDSDTSDDFFVRQQLLVAKEEGRVRATNSTTVDLLNGLRHEAEMNQMLHSSKKVDYRNYAADKLTEKQTKGRWQVRIRRGEFGSEELNAANCRDYAKRGFRWAKADEKDEKEIDVVKTSSVYQLPRPASARPSSGSPNDSITPDPEMSPESMHHRRQARPKSADYKSREAEGRMQVPPSKVPHVNPYVVEGRMSVQHVNPHVNPHGRLHLENWTRSTLSVRDARFRAWRLKVDAEHGPRTFGWPHSSTHRVYPPPPNVKMNPKEQEAAAKAAWEAKKAGMSKRDRRKAEEQEREEAKAAAES